MCRKYKNKWKDTVVTGTSLQPRKGPSFTVSSVYFKMSNNKRNVSLRQNNKSEKSLHRKKGNCVCGNGICNFPVN